jgi:hypothetical protein
MRRLFAVVFAVAAGAASASAQTPQPVQANASTGVEFLPRFDFHVSLEHLVSDQIRYVWDADFGGDIDLVSFGRSRVTFVAVYETILGSEYRAFDPNQGNYTLEGSVSRRARTVEVAGVFHHVSRHLSDRPKRGPVDWNMVGGRVRGGGERGRLGYQARADLRGVIEHTFVDYRWELETEGAARVAMSPRVSVIGSGSWRVVGVDGSRSRDTQRGFRAEGGVRLAGRSAMLDLFVAGEQRIDPYQLELSTVRWLTLGFRISSLAAPRVP